MTTTVEQELQQYILQLSEPQKQSVLQLLKTFVPDKPQEFEPVSLEQYNKELEEAKSEFQRGEYATHEEMLKQMKQERISLEQYNKEIDEAVADIKRGEVYSHEEVVKMAKDW